MKRRIGMMLMAALMMAAMLITASPAQAQQEFNVFCQNAVVPAGCAGSTAPFLFEDFTCDPLVADVGTSSQCTREATGETFECVIEFAQESVARHLCAIPAQAPPGGGDNGNGGGGGKGNGGGGAAAPFEISQDFEQESESGDIDQSFDISGGGDNGSQCANVTGDGNTGNLQNQSGSLQFASDIEEIEQEGIGSDLSVNGDSTATCDQQVNQAAAAG